MLPTINRLKSNQDFSKVHKQGKFFGEKLLAIKVMKNGLESSRFGFVVSTKLSKKAVIRNKVKRRLRAIVGKQLKNINPGYDVVVLVRPEIVDMEYIIIEKSLLNVLNKAGLVSQS